MNMGFIRMFRKSIPNWEPTFDWNQDHALFREAMYTPNKQKRNKLLKQVLKLNPDYFAAEYHLFFRLFKTLTYQLLKSIGI